MITAVPVKITHLVCLANKKLTFAVEQIMQHLRRLLAAPFYSKRALPKIAFLQSHEIHRLFLFCCLKIK
jgi:hypothetical protein